MARKTDTLGALEVDRAKAGSKQQHLFDGGGLFLLVATSGGKWWRFKYNYSGKSKTISFGTYPEISLSQARDRREAARKLLAICLERIMDYRIRRQDITTLAELKQAIAKARNEIIEEYQLTVKL